MNVENIRKAVKFTIVKLSEYNVNMDGMFSY